MAPMFDAVTLLEQFIEDVDNGRVPRLYGLLKDDAVVELLPLVELLSLIEASEVKMPESLANKVRATIMPNQRTGASW